MNKLEKITHELEKKKMKVYGLQVKLAEAEKEFHDYAQKELNIVPGREVTIVDYANLVLKMLALGQDNEA